MVGALSFAVFLWKVPNFLKFLLTRNRACDKKRWRRKDKAYMELPVECYSNAAGGPEARMLLTHEQTCKYLLFMTIHRKHCPQTEGRRANRGPEDRLSCMTDELSKNPGVWPLRRLPPHHLYVGGERGESTTSSSPTLSTRAQNGEPGTNRSAAGPLFF